MVEYDEGAPVAIVDYKQARSPPVDPAHPSNKALIDLADRAGISFFACRYNSELTCFQAIPMNWKAKLWVPTAIDLSERQWVDLLYRLRGRTMPR